MNFNDIPNNARLVSEDSLEGRHNSKAILDDLNKQLMFKKNDKDDFDTKNTEQTFIGDEFNST